MRIEIRVIEMNAIPVQVGKLANTVRYGAQLVIVEIEPIEDSDEN